MTTFHVKGMTCAGCARSVEKALTKRDPQAVVKVNVAAERVSVQSAIAQSELAAAIDAAGFEVEGVIAESDTEAGSEESSH